MKRRIIPGQRPAASESPSALDTSNSDRPTAGHRSETFPANVPLSVALTDDMATHLDQDGMPLQNRPDRAESRKSAQTALHYHNRPETARGVFLSRRCRTCLTEINDPDWPRELHFWPMDRDADTIKLCVDYVRVYPKTSEFEAKK